MTQIQYAREYARELYSRTRITIVIEIFHWKSRLKNDNNFT